MRSRQRQDSLGQPPGLPTSTFYLLSSSSDQLIPLLRGPKTHPRGLGSPLRRADRAGAFARMEPPPSGKARAAVQRGPRLAVRELGQGAELKEGGPERGEGPLGPRLSPGGRGRVLPPGCPAEDARKPHPRAPLDAAPHRCLAPRRDSRKARPPPLPPEERAGEGGGESASRAVSARGAAAGHSGPRKAEPPALRWPVLRRPLPATAGRGTRNSCPGPLKPSQHWPQRGHARDTAPQAGAQGPQKVLRGRPPRAVSLPRSPSKLRTACCRPSPECPRPPSGRVTEAEQSPGNPEIKGETLASLLSGRA